MLKIIDHPLIRHKLTIMRNKDTGTKDFRQNLDEIGGLMAYEVTRNLPVKEVEIETPITSCVGVELAKKIVSDIKATKLKVQASIQGEQVRVSGKDKDDLQAVIQMLRKNDDKYDYPLQFTNYR